VSVGINVLLGIVEQRSLSVKKFIRYPNTVSRAPNLDVESSMRRAVTSRSGAAEIGAQRSAMRR